MESEKRRGPGRPTNEEIASRKSAEVNQQTLDVLKGVAKAVIEEDPARQGLYRRSRQPLQKNGELTPENYDVQAECVKVMEELGHRPGRFVQSPQSNVLPPRPADPHMHQTRCLDCGNFAFARWRGNPRTTGGGRMKPGELAYPVFGGEPTNFTCEELRSGKKQASLQSMSASEA